MIYENVPYRRWYSRTKTGKLVLRDSAAYRRVMRVMGEAIEAGKAVEMDHKIIGGEPRRGGVYDTISVRITA